MICGIKSTRRKEWDANFQAPIIGTRILGIGPYSSPQIAWLYPKILVLPRKGLWTGQNSLTMARTCRRQLRGTRGAPGMPRDDVTTARKLRFSPFAHAMCDGPGRGRRDRSFLPNIRCRERSTYHVVNLPIARARVQRARAAARSAGRAVPFIPL